MSEELVFIIIVGAIKGIVVPMIPLNLVAFKVLFERPEHPFTLEPVPSDILKKEDGGFGVQLTFTGAPSDLEKLKQVIADDGVHAYVLAEDFAPYREGSVEEGKKDRGSIRPVRLEINSDIYPDLAARVGFDQPPPGLHEYRLVVWDAGGRVLHGRSWLQISARTLLVEPR